MSAEHSVLKRTPAFSRAVSPSIYSVLIACCLLVEAGCSTSQALAPDGFTPRVQSSGAEAAPVNSVAAVTASDNATQQVQSSNAGPLVVDIGSPSSTDDELKRRIRSLRPQAGEGELDLEVSSTNVTASENATYVIQHGKASVPYLVEELKGTDPIQVGYAAYCLQEIGAADGTDAAKAAIRPWQRKQKDPSTSREAIFATMRLVYYLSSIYSKSNAAQAADPSALEAQRALFLELERPGSVLDALPQRIEILGSDHMFTGYAIIFNCSVNMDYLIRHGKQSTPFLIEALNSLNKYKVGDAAYCLEKIRAAEGKAAAEAVLSKLKSKEKQDLWNDEYYALPLLESYLRSIAPPASH